MVCHFCFFGTILFSHPEVDQFVLNISFHHHFSYVRRKSVCILIFIYVVHQLSIFIFASQHNQIALSVAHGFLPLHALAPFPHLTLCSALHRSQSRVPSSPHTLQCLIPLALPSTLFPLLSLSTTLSPALFLAHSLQRFIHVGFSLSLQRFILVSLSLSSIFYST